MLSRTGAAVLCAAAACQAFHIPARIPSTSWISSTTTRQQQRACQTFVSPRRNVLRMKAGAKKGEEAAAKGEAESKVGEGEKAGGAPAPAEPEAIVFKADEEDELELDVEAAKSIAEEEAWNKANKVKKRKLTPTEQAYVDRISSAPTIYKHIPEADLYPSVGYDSAFGYNMSDNEKYTGNSMAANEEGKEDILLRVMIIGGDEEEGQFLKMLSEKGAGKLVEGLYVLWDLRECELSETISNVNFVNIHELGPDVIKNPQKVAAHASFMAAHMLVAVKAHPLYGKDYVSQLKQAALNEGLTFVAPNLAAEVAKGEMATFTKLVQDTRAALAE